jgi:hypothetical protein
MTRHSRLPVEARRIPANQRSLRRASARRAHHASTDHRRRRAFGADARRAEGAQGAAWSIVQAVGIGSLLNYTVVPTDKPKKLTLQAQESKIVQFELQVPAKVSPGGYVCADVFFGDDRQQPHFNTLRQTSVFCITKDAPATRWSDMRASVPE